MSAITIEKLPYAFARGTKCAQSRTAIASVLGITGRGAAIAMTAAVGVYEPRAIADAVLHEVVRCPLAASLAQTTQLAPIALRCRFHRSRPRQ